MDQTETGSPHRIKVLQSFLLYGLIVSVGCLIIFIVIPADPKNIWMFGYSKTRLGIFLGFIAASLIFLGLMFKSSRDTSRLDHTSKWIENIVNEYGWFIPTWILGFGIFVLGPNIAIIIKNPLEGFYLRIFPLVLYASLLTLGIFVVFVIALVDKSKQRKMLDDRQVFQFTPHKVVVVLSAIFVLFLLANFAGTLIDTVAYDPKIFRYTKKLYLDRETSIPTYYSSLLLLISAVLFALIARLKQLSNSSYKYHWILLSVIFLLMSVDETASLHEQLNKPMRLMFNPSGILLFAWVIVAIPLFLLFVIAYLRFFFHLPRKTKTLFAIATGLYIGGAIGFELIGAGLVSQYGFHNLIYFITAIIEESMEIVGLLFLIYALLDYMSSSYDSKHYSLVISEASGVQLMDDE